MKRTVLYMVVLALISTLVLAGCAPAAAPPAAPTHVPIAPTQAPGAAPKSTLAPGTDDTTWQKVVEAAKKEGKLTVYSYSMTGDIAVVTAKAFENRYGIKMDVISGRGAAFIERIKTEQRVGQVAADIMEASSTHSLILKGTGNSVSSLNIPALREKDVWSMDPRAADSEGHALAHRSMYFSAGINTNLVKPGQEPKSFRDIAKPEWKGKLVLADPALAEGEYTLFLPLVDRGYLNMEFVRSLRDLNPRFVPSTREVAWALAKGEAALGLPLTDVDGAAYAVEGAPIRGVSLEEGTIVNLSCVIAVKNGPHPNAAKLFMNWILGVEGQSVYNKAIGLASVRKDVPDFRPAAIAVAAKRLVPVTEEDAQRVAKAFRDKLLVEMWRR